jgi:hypothetical protein
VSIRVKVVAALMVIIAFTRVPRLAYYRHMLFALALLLDHRADISTLLKQAEGHGCW